MSNEFVARNGLIALDNSIVTGSLNVTNGITGSLLGTASFATTASFALNAGGAAASSNLIFSGSVTASVDVTANTFRLISGSSTFLYVSSSGRVGINTTTPTAQLDIRKSAQSVSNIVLSGPNNFNAGDFKGLGITNYYSDVTTTNRQLAIYNTDNTNYPYFRVSISNLNYASIDAITGSTAALKDLFLHSTVYITSGSNVGIGTTVPAAKLQVSGTVNVANIRGSGSATTQSIFTVDGAAGRLFSVNDSLSGSLFSVNTIAGLPIVEAFSDNTVRIGQYGQRALFVSQSRVGIGKETALNANIDISGSAIITGSLTTTGTITAQTLVVQTITSSVSLITGSTQFGSIISNTHQFTGSINVSGSITGTPGVTNTLTSSFAISASWAPSTSAFALLSTQSYTTAGTFEWNKPNGAQIISVIVVGGGGGGASGAAAVGSGVAGGAGGGSGGGVVMVTLPASVFDVTESVVVGAGGKGGTGSVRIGAGANATTAGQNGFAGSDSSFGEITAPGGGSGSYTAANNALGLGGAPPNITPTITADSAAAGYTIASNYTPLIAYSGPGGSGAATDKSPTAVAPLTMSTFVPTGGGYGGTPGSTTTDEAGSAGGFSNTSFGLISGGAGGTSGLITGSDGSLVYLWFGTGGGGGFGDYAASGAALGSDGGSGSIGAGGGGGGSARNNTNTNPNSATSGDGGPGGTGAVIVYTYGTV